MGFVNCDPFDKLLLISLFLLREQGGTVRQTLYLVNNLDLALWGDEYRKLNQIPTTGHY